MNDSLYFFRAKKEDCEAILEILNIYEKASRQQINFEKSGLWFSHNTSNNAKHLPNEILNIEKVIRDDPYLGLSLSFERNKGRQF